MDILDAPRGIALTATRKLTQESHQLTNERTGKCGAKADAEPADLHEASKLFFSCFFISGNQE